MGDRLVERVALDSCVIIDLLQGDSAKNPWIKPLTRDAQNGRIKLMASAIAACEVITISGQADARKKIIAFFYRPDIEVHAVDLRIADYVRELIDQATGLKPADAIHVATAALHNANALLTRDAGGRRASKSMLSLDGKPLPRGHQFRIMTPQGFNEMMASTEDKPLINGVEK